MSESASQRQRMTFPRTMRLSGGSQFARVYAARTRTSAGPLLVYAAPNELGFARLGLSVSRRVGKASVRNSIKRRLREAFRHLQHDWRDPKRDYDLVISVRAHEPLALNEYKQHLLSAVRTLQSTWSKKLHKQNPPANND